MVAAHASYRFVSRMVNLFLSSNDAGCTSSQPEADMRACVFLGLLFVLFWPPYPLLASPHREFKGLKVLPRARAPPGDPRNQTDLTERSSASTDDDDTACVLRMLPMWTCA